MLHIGAMKTGTTYLQGLLKANTGLLGEAGWAVPPQRRVVRGTRQIMALTDEGKAGRGPAPHWERLMDGARAHRGVGTVASMEFLSFARRPRMQNILKSAEGLDLRIVLTVRDAARALPSQWQSLSRNGGVLSWPEFAAATRASGLRRTDRGAKAFRRTQDIPRMVDVWSQGVSPERFIAITVPVGGPREVLWERFLEPLGIDPGSTDQDTTFDNPQLGYGSCELLRLLNAAGLNAAPPSVYRRVVRRLSRDSLFGLREEQTRPRLDLATAQFAAHLNERTSSALRNSTTWIGSPDELPTTVHDSSDYDPGPRPRQAPDAEVLEAARQLHSGALAYFEQLELSPPPELLAPPPDDLDLAIPQLTALLMVAMTGEVSHRPGRGALTSAPTTFST